jgi:hypothetical protein
MYEMMKAAGEINYKIVDALSKHRTSETMSSIQSSTPVIDAPDKSVAPLKTLFDPRDWDVECTVEYLRKKGFGSYADYFLEESMIGIMLLAVEEADIDTMRETIMLKKKGFLMLVKAVQEEARAAEIVQLIIKSDSNFI